MASLLSLEQRMGARGVLDRKGTRGSRGQSLVEFALVLPVFLMLCWGTIDFGFALSSSVTVANAAREGARYGTATLDANKIRTRVLAAATNLNAADITVTTTCERNGFACSGTFTAGSIANGKTDDIVIVRVDYIYRTMTPIALGATINLSTTTRMRVE